MIAVYLSRYTSGPYDPIAYQSDAYWRLNDVGGNLRLDVWTDYPGWYYRVVVIYSKDSAGKIARYDDQRLWHIAQRVVW